MSHFTVLVVGADHAVALQPFHEFECTGTNDQYVQSMDITDEARAKFATQTSTRLKAPDGTLHDFFDARGEWRPEFSQPDPEASAFDKGRRTYFVPSGHEKVEVPTSQVRSFAEWIEGWYGIKPVTNDQPFDIDGDHKYGYVQMIGEEVERVIDRTNPNKKWDWWTVGGRWPNKLLFRDGTKGSRGLVGDLDLDGMLAEQSEQAAQLFDRVTAAVAGREIHSWASVLKRRDGGEFTIDQARDFYNGQAIVKELEAAEVIDRWDGADQLNGVLAAIDRASYIQREAEVNSTTWALLHDGHWNERGAMGWFGMSDATDGSTLDYAQNYWLTLRSLPATETVTVVDCHI